MAKESTSIIVRTKKLLKRPGFWFIFLVLAVITLPYYSDRIQHPAFIAQIWTSFGLERHAFERILYLAPIIWAGFLFGRLGAFFTSLVALACMLPRVVFATPFEADGLWEASAVFALGNIVAISFDALRKEREHRFQLEASREELRSSEERYRELFESAHDAIWLQDLNGNIVTSNQATEKLTGYGRQELARMKAGDFLTADSLKVLKDIQDRLRAGETIDQPFEVSLVKKDGSRAYVQLAANPVLRDGRLAAIQHIARDTTEQKRLQENLFFYLQQITQAQEDERKRISRELHDESIQELITTSRELDALASRDKDLSESSRRRLEELRQQVNAITQELRRLVQGLRPAVLDRLGLLPALEWLVSDAAGYSGVKTKLEITGTKRRLDEDTELALFRIVQEALRNVARHSGAAEASIVVDFKDGSVRITVSDNGRGFKVPPVIGDFARSGKLGLSGMQERARLIGGSVSVESEPGAGTTITIEIKA